MKLCHFIAQWKRAFIRPLSKVKIPKSPSDTRPLANLCEISKIFKRIVFKQIIHYLESNDILDSRQSNYRRGYSTQTALLRLTDDIRSKIDKRELTLLVVFDFSKAFDTVSHPKLISKLKMVGFSDSELSWVFSYLVGRTEAIIDDDGSCSDWRFTTTGVP